MSGKKGIRMDGDVGRFVKSFEENWYPKWPPLPTEHKVLDAVKDGSFFGLVRCDMRVPLTDGAFFRDDPSVWSCKSWRGAPISSYESVCGLVWYECVDT